MKDWNELKNILNRQNISSEDQQLIHGFLIFFTLQKRQQLIRVLMGYADKLPFFINLIKKKKLLTQNFDAPLAGEVLHLENEFIAELIKEINLKTN